MPGIVARLVMSNLMKSKERNEHYVPRDYAAVREQARKLSALQPLPRKIHRIRDECGFWYEWPGANRSRVILYIHGGGFNSGGAEYSYNMVRYLCRTRKWAVYSVEYRLAPEHPYPAALEDCAAAYRRLLSLGIPGRNILFAGDSAGGNLVFALALYLRDQGIELPAGLCGLSPVGTLDDSMPSRRERAERDAIIGSDFTEEMQATYVREHDPKIPYLSPVYGDFTGLPPIWICVGTEEVFYDDAFALQKAAQKAGISVKLLVGKGMCHVYPMIPDSQSRKALRSMLHFMENQLLGGNT